MESSDESSESCDGVRGGRCVGAAVRAGMIAAVMESSDEKIDRGDGGR